MLVMKDMSSGEVDMDYAEEYEDEALSSEWNPAIADVIHREIDRYEISQAENPMPADLAEVDASEFLEKMYNHM